MKDILLKKYFKLLKVELIHYIGLQILPEVEIINKNKYCLCDINNKEELEKSIKYVSNNPNEYIDGELFTKDAGKQIELFYSTLSESILLKINT